MAGPPPRASPVRPAPVPPDEERLAEGLIAGSREAIAAFLHRAHHPVFCMACKLTADPDLRRDWTHSTLLGILDDLERGRFAYRGPGSFWAWFRTRAHYRLLDEYRRHRRRETRESTTDAEGEARELSDFPGAEDPVDEVERVELLAALEHCLDRLPSVEQRRALGLLLLEDLSYEDVAQAMQAPLNTVRSWIRRGRLAVRKCLAETLGLEGKRGADD